MLAMALQLPQSKTYYEGGGSLFLLRGNQSLPTVHKGNTPDRGVSLLRHDICQIFYTSTSSKILNFTREKSNFDPNWIGI